jgi:osmotically-inducible protein OsmY
MPETATDRAMSQSVANVLLTAGLPLQSLTNIQVRTMSGRVTLVGRVQNEEERKQIGEQAKKVPGVLSVNNLLRVGESAAETAPSAELDRSED